MQLSTEELAVYTATAEALKQVNEGLKQLRHMKIACNLEETLDRGYWLLDAKVLITKDALSPK